MKSLKFKQLLVTLFCFCFTITNAQQIEFNGILYELEYHYDYDGPKVAVTGISDEKIEELVIPETIDYNNKSYAVEVVGYKAFMDNLNIKSVSLSDNITYILEEAFKGCTNLEKVTLGNSVKSIGDEAFDDCNKIKNINFPGTLTRIGIAAFQDCNSLTEIYLPDNITYLGTAAFVGCSEAKSITIGKGIKKLRMATFAGCNATDIYTKSQTPIECEDESVFLLNYSARLFVPIGCKAAYEAAFPWNYFNIYETDFTSVDCINEDITNNTYYDLKGSRIESPRRGIYIVNGKKILLK